MKLEYYPSKYLDMACDPVEFFDEVLHKQLDEMKKIMEEHKGLGLAANQVGLNKRMFLFKDNKGIVHEVINPKIKSTNGAVSISEGCLSAPDVFVSISRPEDVGFEYQDRNGEWQNALAFGLEARAVLHEYDHLDGIFFLSKVNRQIRRAAIAKLKRQ